MLRIFKNVLGGNGSVRLFKKIPINFIFNGRKKPLSYEIMVEAFRHFKELINKIFSVKVDDLIGKMLYLCKKILYS